MKKLIAGLTVFAGLCATTPCGFAETRLTTERVAVGLALPLYVTHAPGDTTRAFIIEQRSGTTGRIRILDLTTNPPTLLPTPFLSISPVSTGDEQGLLGLAFHPDYANNGRFYVNYTNPTTVVAEYQVSGNPNIANAVATRTIFSIAQPFSNHNGGWIEFGPDGYLYISLGDGGSANDPGNRAQNLTINLGKMLRIDIDGADNIPGNDDDDGVIGSTVGQYTSPPDNPFVGIAGNDEIWAYGLRNPWRCSFDRETGDLYMGDVGQESWEEISFQPWHSTGGENYGWRCMEGLHCTGLSGCTCNGPALTLPILEYSSQTGSGNCSVTGGYVYRGCQIWDLRGTYFFADYCSARIWSFRYDEVNGMTEFTNRTTELAPGGGLAINTITSFGEDAAGNLYICDRGGEVFRIKPNGPVVGDMNNDGVFSPGDIAMFVLALTDPATYEAMFPGVLANDVGDVNGDGVLSPGDIAGFVNLIVNGPCP